MFIALLPDNRRSTFGHPDEARAACAMGHRVDRKKTAVFRNAGVFYVVPRTMVAAAMEMIARETGNASEAMRFDGDSEPIAADHSAER